MTSRLGMRIGPYAEILRLVWPLALGMVNNAVMQFVDRAYLARYSMEALEAVLPAAMLAWIFLSFFQSVVSYAGVFVSQYHGAGDDARCTGSYRAGLLIALVSGVLMLPLVPLGGWVFAATARSPELAAMERAYYDIVAAGGVFVFVQMAASAYFTGRGRTRLVFWVNVLGNLLNIALDPVLIFGLFGAPRLGIAGAAYATVAATAVQCVALFAFAHRGAPEAHRVAAVSDTLAVAARVLRFGVPSGGYSVLNILSFTIFVFVTGRVGDVEFAASNACFTVNYLLFAPMEGFALGAQTLVGQARGRGDDAEAFAAARRTILLGVGFVSMMAAFVLAFHSPILELFAPPDASDRAQFMSLGFTLFLFMETWMLFDAMDVILSGALKGAGDSRFVFWWMLVASFLLWMPLVALAAKFWNTMPALWGTMVVYVVVISIGSLVRWKRGRWRAIKLIDSSGQKGGTRE